LYERLEMELDHARSYAPLAGLVGAWARKPSSHAQDSTLKLGN
jgi:hypothetical protein